MKKTLVCLVAVLVLLLALAACGSGGNSGDAEPSATLPPPQVRVETLPSATPELFVPSATPEAATLEATAQVQAWPTMTDEEYEQYLLDLVDGKINDIENRLDNTDTDIRP